MIAEEVDRIESMIEGISAEKPVPLALWQTWQL